MGRRSGPSLRDAIRRLAGVAAISGILVMGVAWWWQDRLSSLLQLDPIAYLAASWAAALVVSLITSLIALPRVLAPVQRLGRSLRQLDPADLELRLDGAQALQELRLIYDGINDRLADVQAAFERERSFAAQVAHDLRTPLAGLQSEVDVTLSKTRSAEDYRASLEIVREQSKAIGGMLDQLLRLAQGELGTTTALRQPYRLADLLQESWRPFAAAADERDLQIDWQVAGSIILLGGRDKLRLVLANLLANTARYTDTGGQVTIKAQASDEGGAVLVISNTGSKVAANEVQRVVERYWRGKRERGDERGYGLGMHLVARLLSALRAKLRIASWKGGLFQVEVRLPNHLVTIENKRQA